MADAVFYPTYSCEPYYNMAFDEWLFGRAISVPGAVFIRLYTWQVPAITFGCNQKQDTALDFDRVGETTVIRRLTGGRALFHDRSELTYAVAINTEAGPGAAVGDSVASSSRRIATILSGFLLHLGVKSSYARQSSPEEKVPAFFHKASCFESVSRYELVSGDQKIVASAQKRVGRSFLQHGSIKLRGTCQHPALGSIAGASRQPGQAVEQEEFNSYARAFKASFVEALGLEAVEPELGFGQRMGLSALEIRVRKNALRRRGMFAQNVDVDSL